MVRARDQKMREKTDVRRERGKRERETQAMGREGERDAAGSGRKAKKLSRLNFVLVKKVCKEALTRKFAACVIGELFLSYSGILIIMYVHIRGTI